MSGRSANLRIRLLVLLFGLVFALMLARAAWIQAVKGASYEAIASRQHRETIRIPAGRGTIYDRTGEPLAIGEQATTVFADPRTMENPKRAAVAAAKAFGLDPNELYRRFTDHSKGFLYVSRKADPIRAAALEKQHISGLGFYPEELRWYPQEDVAAHVVGFAGLDNKGLEGLERTLEQRLAGTPGYETIVKDPFGRTIDVVTSRPEQPGGNVTLTLDHQIQAHAEDVLARKVARWHAKGGTAVVLDPRTGAILAMANAPSFDANRFGETPADRRRNRAVTDVFEPGSTFKIVTVAAALEDGLVTPKTAFTLPYKIQVADRWIHDSHWRPTRQLTVKQILSQSSNVGIATIAQLLGREELARWISRFGFGRQTGVDFPGESPGMMLPLDRWSGTTIGTVPIGQGIAVTPVQMASAFAAIGYHGVQMRPHLVEKVGGKRVRLEKGRRIVSRATADRVMAMLRDVVVEGTGIEAAVPGYTVAGKTGTANKPENGVYVRKYVASFVGLVPARRPRLAILVMVDEPKGAIWGGVVAAPAFAEIARFSLQYLEVPPDAPRTNEGLASTRLGSGAAR